MSYRFRCDQCGGPNGGPGGQGFRDDICEDCGYCPPEPFDASKYETLTCSIMVAKALLEDAVNLPAIDEMVADLMRDAALDAMQKRRREAA